MNHLMKSGLLGLAASASMLSASFTYADNPITVDIYKATTEGRGDPIGTVTLEENRYGVLITASLEQLSPGPHGFHLHQHPDCSPKKKDGQIVPAGSAGSHFDPEDTGVHLGPYDPDGHLGDLPRLYAGKDGTVELPVLAPRLELKDFPGHALVVHEGGDNYSDDPKPLGGGGSRVACGVIPAL